MYRDLLWRSIAWRPLLNTTIYISKLYGSAFRQLSEKRSRQTPASRTNAYRHHPGASAWQVTDFPTNRSRSCCSRPRTMRAAPDAFNSRRLSAAAQGVESQQRSRAHRPRHDAHPAMVGRLRLRFAVCRTARGLASLPCIRGRAVSRIKCNTLSVSSDFLVHHLGRGHPSQRLARSPVHQLGDMVEFFLADAR